MTYEQFITLLKVYIDLYRQALCADALSYLLKKKTVSSYHKENYLIHIPQNIIKREKTAIERLAVHDSKDPRLGNLIGERLDGGITIHLTYKTIINHLPSLINNLVHGYITKHPEDREKLLGFLGSDPILGKKTTPCLSEIKAVLEHHIQKKTNLADWSRAREIAAKETKPISEQDCHKTIQERYISHQKKLQTRLNIGCDQPLLTWYDVVDASIGTVDCSQKNLNKQPSPNSNKGLKPLLNLFNQYAGDYLHYQKLKENFPLSDFAGSCPEGFNETLLDDVILSLDNLTSSINRLPRKQQRSFDPLKTLISEVRVRIQACTQNLTKQNMTLLCVSLEKLFKHDLDMLVTLVITAGVDPKYEEKLQAVIKKKIKGFIDASQKEADKKFNNTVRNFKKEYPLYNQRQAIIEDIEKQIDKRYGHLETQKNRGRLEKLSDDINFVDLLSNIRNKEGHLNKFLRSGNDTNNSSAKMIISFRVGILAEELRLYANKLSKITRKPLPIKDVNLVGYDLKGQISEVGFAIGTVREEFQTSKFQKLDDYYYRHYQQNKSFTHFYSETDEKLVLVGSNGTSYPIGQHSSPILADVSFINILKRFLNSPPLQNSKQKQFSPAAEIFTWAHSHDVKPSVAKKIVGALIAIEDAKSNYTPESLHDHILKAIKPALKSTKSDESIFGTPSKSTKKDTPVQSTKKSSTAKSLSVTETKKLKSIEKSSATLSGNITRASSLIEKEKLQNTKKGSTTRVPSLTRKERLQLVLDIVNNSSITTKPQVFEAFKQKGYKTSLVSINHYFKELSIDKIDGVYQQQALDQQTVQSLGLSKKEKLQLVLDTVNGPPPVVDQYKLAEGFKQKGYKINQGDVSRYFTELGIKKVKGVYKAPADVQAFIDALKSSKKEKLQLVLDIVNNSSITTKPQVFEAFKQKGCKTSLESIDHYFKELNINKIDGVYKQQSPSPKKGTTLYSGLAVFGPGNIRIMVEQTKILAVKAGKLFKTVAVYADSQRPRWKVVAEETKQSVHIHVPHPETTRDTFITDANGSFASTSPLVQTNASRFSRTVTNTFKGSTRAFISRGGMDMVGVYLITTAASPFTHNPNILRNIGDFSVFVTAPLEHFVHSTQGTPLGIFGTTSLVTRHYMSHAVQGGKFILVKAGTATTATTNVLKETGSLLRRRVFQAAAQGGRFILVTAGTVETAAIVSVAIPVVLVTDMLVNAPEKNASSISEYLHLYKNGAMSFDQVLFATYSDTYRFNQCLEKEDSRLKKMMFIPDPCELPRLTSQTEISFNNGFGVVVLIAFAEKGIEVHSLKRPIPLLQSNPIKPYLSSGQNKVTISIIALLP